MTTTNTPNAIVGNGRAVHAFKKGTDTTGRLTHDNIRCGAGWTNRSGRMVAGKVTLTDWTVTCKRCVNFLASDAIWAGEAPAAVTEAPAPAVAKVAPLTAAAAKAFALGLRKGCGGEGRHAKANAAASLTYDGFTPATAAPKPGNVVWIYDETDTAYWQGVVQATAGDSVTVVYTTHTAHFAQRWQGKASKVFTKVVPFGELYVVATTGAIEQPHKTAQRLNIPITMAYQHQGDRHRCIDGRTYDSPERGGCLITDPSMHDVAMRKIARQAAGTR